MKAEQRKEIETNKLGAWLRRMRAKLEGRGLYMLVGSLVLVVATVLIIRFWLSSRDSTRSARTIQLKDAMEVDEIKKYDEIIGSEKHAGHPTALYAKVLKARKVLYGEGLDRLGSQGTEARNSAFIKLEEGRKLYNDVVNDLKDYPVLQQEAWISCARAEEGLLGVTDPSGQFKGNFDKMIDYWKKAAAINPGSEASKGYEAKANSLQQNRASLEDFSRQIYRAHLEDFAREQRERDMKGKIDPRIFNDPRFKDLKLPHDLDPSGP